MKIRGVIVYLVFISLGLMVLVGVVNAWTNPSANPPSGSPGPIPIGNGGTAASTTGTARSNLGAAASGANSDITSITGLTTALGVAYGGTGTITGSITGTGALTFTAGGTNQNITLTPSGTGIITLGGNAAFGTTPATSGLIRVPNNSTLYFRNAANTADLRALFFDTGNNIVIGDPTSSLSQIVQINANGVEQFWASGAVTRLFGTGGLSLNQGAGTASFGSSYNVGIGTTGPLASLQISGGNVHVQGSFSNSNQLRITGTGAVGTGNDAVIRFDTPSNSRIIYVDESDANKLKFTGGGATDLVTIDNTGNVGIGTTTPGYKLDVVSGGATTARFGTVLTDTVIIGGGAGKLDTGTVDPIYTIGGEKYATYLPGMTGVKEETTGIVVLKNGQYQVDLTKAEQGSDTWLFYQATDFGASWGNLSVLLSPAFNGKVWYKKDSSAGKLTIYGDENGEVSYRLTAPRFDHQNWSNFSNSTADGFMLIPK